jgi:hypothetical protein
MRLFSLIGILEFLAGLMGGHGFAYGFYGEPTGWAYTFLGLTFASGFLYYYHTEGISNESKHF